MSNKNICPLLLRVIAYCLKDAKAMDFMGLYGTLLCLLNLFNRHYQHSVLTGLSPCNLTGASICTRHACLAARTKAICCSITYIHISLACICLYHTLASTLSLSVFCFFFVVHFHSADAPRLGCLVLLASEYSWLETEYMICSGWWCSTYLTVKAAERTKRTPNPPTCNVKMIMFFSYPSLHSYFC